MQNVLSLVSKSNLYPIVEQSLMETVLAEVEHIN